MNPDSQAVSKLFPEVLDAMLRAGWLEGHSFVEGKGHHLVWSSDGAQRAALIKRIAQTFRLLDDDRAAIRFGVSSNGRALPGHAFPDEPAITAFWFECVDQLGIRGDADRLLVMVHIANSWAPDADTPVILG